ncbi:MAG: hypothetical protein ACRCWY_01780 [Cellulosilyticaceae bacterium]
MFKKWFETLKEKYNRKPSLHHHYKCKINHRKSKILLTDNLLRIKQKNSTENIDYRHFEKVRIQTKWWRIRVLLHLKEGKYFFDFPSYKQAYAFYEDLIYKKVANRL